MIEEEKPVSRVMGTKIQIGHTIDLTIDRMAYGGQGIGRTDGFVVFVRGVAVGDRIRARINRKKRGYAEADLVRILTPSPDRIQAPCPYSGPCGGCQWQYVAYERQLEYKKDQVIEALVRIGGLKDVIVSDVIPSEKLFSYRNKMEFSFSDRRWFLQKETNRPEADLSFALGLHVPGTFSRVIDMDACMLQPETGNQILQKVKEYVKNSGIPVYGLKSHVGFWRFLTIRHSQAFDEWMVNLVTSEEKQGVVRPLANLLREEVGRLKTVVNNISRKKASIAVGESENVLLGEGIIKDSLGPFAFQVSANSFFQPNSLAAEKLYQKVVDCAELRGTEVVLDLYSGTGTIPIFLSRYAHRVLGIEISQSAMRDAQENVLANAIDNCEFIWGDVRERLVVMQETPDLLIIDPPRAGMHKDVLGQVLNLAPERVVYVSCNPTTLARDLSKLAARYEILEILPFDMFPHTYHVETIANLRLRKMNTISQTA